MSSSLGICGVDPKQRISDLTDISRMQALLDGLGNFFSFGVLDYRLEPSPGVRRRQMLLSKIYATSSGRAASKNAKKEGLSVSAAPPPLWNTWEFRFYYLAFAIVVPLMIKAVMDASNEKNPNYPLYEPLLSPGWIFGRKADNSDLQYSFFRDNLPLLVGLMILHTTLKRIVLKLTSISKVNFDFGFGIIFVFAAHGVNSIKIFTQVLLSFGIGRAFKANHVTATLLTWIFGISLLFFNDKYAGTPFGDLMPCLSFLDGKFEGLIPRWDVFFNFTLLKMISFNMDFLEKWAQRADKVENSQSHSKLTPPGSRGDSPGSVLFKSGSTSAASSTLELSPLDLTLNEKARLVAPHPLNDYSLVHYIAYVTYTPLFIAGPIITFNDYLYQCRHTLPSISIRSTVVYGIRFAFCLLSMEIIIHFAYVVAVSKTKAWKGDSPFQISMIALFNLNIVWLKLLIPWRLFRLWALMDSIDPPENMIRCVYNNYSALAFWRAWHRSFNKWVVRYIYVPLGGSSNRILTSLAVFSFVAIWHDIQLRLLIWGWLVVLFLIPEMLATKYLTRYADRKWYRPLCAAGGVINIWMMMIANLFGFCMGSDGTKQFLHDTFGTWPGIKFAFVASACLFIAVQVMFEQRQNEKRNGIDLRC